MWNASIWNNFIIDWESLKAILESSHKVQELHLINCKIWVNEGYAIDAELNYHIEVLNLSMSYCLNDTGEESFGQSKQK